MKIDSPECRALFWSHVQPAADNRCWLWMRSYHQTSRGVSYGHTLLGGVNRNAYRLAYYYAHGKWPKNACHTCDNPSCCNPQHLVDGTSKWNTQDMLRKRRHRPPVGTINGQAKLNEDDVRAIRAAYASGKFTQRQLGDKYRVKGSNIGHIIARKSWKHTL